MEPEDFKGKLFNLITREGRTGLIFSERMALTDAMLDAMTIFLWQHREPVIATPEASDERE